MRKKLIAAGIGCVLLGIWFYAAISSFPVDENSFPKRIVISEGTVRTDSEVAEALSKEMGFDLEGAYRSGYTPMEVVEYLIKEPHHLSVVYHEGTLYEGRRTVPHIIPFAICILVVLAGAFMILAGLKSGKNR
ncbi:MAG: hypothetical protein JSU90_12130 [Nitrospiraceae bacterium]|nr:MAG: hypothetical protein JSU90_12130 [Nitrospiraceae bacterium]